jgi:phage gpG-like protein
MKLVVTPWKRFYAIRDKRVDARFLDALAHEAEDRFRIGLARPKSGIHYPGLPRRSSRAGEFPANQFGPLRDSISSDVTSTSATVGSNVHYSIYLRMGTSKMGARKMAPEALDEAIPRVRSMLKGFVRWAR